MVLTIQTFLTEVDRSCTCILISYLENSCPEAVPKWLSELYKDFDYALKTGPAEAYPVLAVNLHKSQRRELNPPQKSLEVPHGFTYTNATCF